jgi:putative PIN family toxin of toxin-antitoxin system
VIRAVVDTNVLVSALISPAGNEALILLAVRQGLVKPSFCEDILQEYAAVSARPKFGFPSDEIEALIALLRSQGEEVLDPEPLASGLPDPGDDKFLACAKAAGSILS